MIAFYKLMVCTAAVLVSVFPVQAADVKAYFPPSNATWFPRFRLHGTLTDLREFTFCSWIKPDRLKGHILSYATKESINEFALSLLVESSKIAISIQRRNNVSEAVCSEDPTSFIGYWHRLCVTWRGSINTTKVFLNGRGCLLEPKSVAGPYLPGGGVLIIGQAQKVIDSEFILDRAWNGDIADVQLWDEAFKTDKITEMGRCRRQRKEGNVITWMKSPMIGRDGVIVQQTEIC